MRRTYDCRGGRGVPSLALLTGCGAADMTKQASPFANAQGAKTVTLSVQSWVGAQANVAVAQYLLEHELGYRVDTVQVDEVPAWDALSQGRVDAHPGGLGPPRAGTAVRQGQEDDHARRRPRRDRAHRLVRPDVLRQAAPGRHRTGRTSTSTPTQLRTAESGGKGQLMDGSPVLRHQRQGAGEEPGPGLPGGVRRFRGRADHPDEAVRQGEEALPDLLVRAAVAVQEGPDDRGEAARVQGGLRRGPGRRSPAPIRTPRCRSTSTRTSRRAAARRRPS